VDFKKSKQLLAKLAAGYWILVIMIYLVAGNQFRFLPVTSDTLSPSASVGEITDGVQITQRMTVPADRLDCIELMTVTYGRINAGTLKLELTDENGTAVGRAQLDASAVKDNSYTSFPLQQPVEGYRGQTLWMTLSTEGSVPGSAASVCYGNTVVAGRFDVLMQIEDADKYTFNGQNGGGRLCARMTGIEYLNTYWTYWIVVGGLFAAAAVLALVWWKQAQAGRNNPLAMFCVTVNRYGFLLRQLVARDFKTKYKRSVLGMAWSFLNPLLTMAVQYVVFSTLFKSDMPNYAVYLLTGIVLFSFFNEAVGMGMTAVTGNATLIKKVYMPKYIYPLSRVISSLVNLGLSLIPLLLVTVVTGTPLRPSLLLLVYDLGCLLMFVTGMVLLLSACMVFFRDTQFLWGVVSMMWMYLTPIFYPETIIPSRFLTLYHMNPMYQYLTFARICIIDGVSPAPMAYVWCLVSALGVLGIGIVVFRRYQDKFVMQL